MGRDIRSFFGGGKRVLVKKCNKRIICELYHKKMELLFDKSKEMKDGEYLEKQIIKYQYLHICFYHCCYTNGYCNNNSNNNTTCYRNMRMMN